MLRRTGTILVAVMFSELLCVPVRAASSAPPPQVSTGVTSGVCNCSSSSDDWIKDGVNSLVSILVGFGAAYIGMLATRRATERGARDAIDAQRLARREDLQERVRLAIQALARELDLNLSIMGTQQRLFRNIPLQKTYIDVAFSLSSELGQQLLTDLQTVSFFVEKYNALVGVLTSATPEVSIQIVSELERMLPEGKRILSDLKTGLEKIKR